MVFSFLISLFMQSYVDNSTNSILNYVDVILINIYLLGILSATASLGLIYLWDVHDGLALIKRKYLVASNDYIKVSINENYINSIQLIFFFFCQMSHLNSLFSVIKNVYLFF